MMTKKINIKEILIQVVYLFLGLLMISPILYAVSLSLMEPQYILSEPPKLITPTLHFENYKIALETTLLLKYTFNSFVMATLASIVRVIFCSMAGFAFAFFEFRFKKILFGMTLMTMMIPPDVLVVSNFTTISKMGLLDSYLGMSIVFFVAAVNVFLFRQQFLTFAKSLKEAAHLDGCNNIQFFFRILIPSNIPIMVTVFISSFVSVWNQYLWPMIVTRSDEMRTVQVGVSMLNFPEATAYGPLMAGAIIALLPTVLIFILFQRRIVGGMMTGSVKE